MPSVTARGLVTIQASIGPDALRRDYCDRNMERCADDIVAPALIDTGAEVCIVDSSLLKALRIHAYDKRNLRGGTGAAEQHPVYSIWLKVFTKEGKILIDQPTLEVLGAPILNEDYQIILGIDVFALRDAEVEPRQTVGPPLPDGRRGRASLTGRLEQSGPLSPLSGTQRSRHLPSLSNN